MSTLGGRIYELTDTLSFARPGGTEEELRAANILLNELREIGLEGTLEQFQINDTETSEVMFQVLEPYQKTYTVSGYKNSRSAFGEVLDFVYVEDALDVNLANVSDKLVLTNIRLNYARYEKLIRAGVKGIATFGGTLHDKIGESDLSIGMLRETLTNDFGATIAINMRVSDAMELVLMKATKIKVTVKNENVKRTSHNVRALLPGKKHSETILLGAHYDSVMFSSGSYDNASGAAILMELARCFFQQNPEYTLEFCWFGSEEMGRLGSKHHVISHAKDMKKCILMMNIDLAGPTMGHDVAVVTGENAIANYLDAEMKCLGLAIEVTQDIYASDNMEFANIGIPCISFARYGADGAVFVHDRFDTMDFISAEALEKTFQIAYIFARRMADAVSFPFKRTIPPEMGTKIDKYFHKPSLTESNDRSE